MEGEAVLSEAIVPPSSRPSVWSVWAIGVGVTAVCAGMGGLLGALTLDPEDLRVQPFLWGVLASALPSLVAGWVFARNASGRRDANPEGMDQLTGLFGPDRLRQDLEVEWSRSARLGKHVGMVLADLEQGERLTVPSYVAWRALARTLRAATRASDSAYVLGPGRFAVLLSLTNKGGSDVVIDRLRKAVQAVPELYEVRLRLGGHEEDPSHPSEPGPDDLFAGARKAAEQATPESIQHRTPDPVAEVR